MDLGRSATSVPYPLESLMINQKASGQGHAPVLSTASRRRSPAGNHSVGFSPGVSASQIPGAQLLDTLGYAESIETISKL
jgi:hypothetical protein